jgi:PAS domain S-box-containing protein
MPLGVAFSTGIGIAFSYTIIRSNLFLVNPTLTASTIVDSISQALVVTGPDNIIEKVNTATSDLLGYEKDELTGQNMHKLLADQKSWENFINQVVEPLKTKKIIKNYQTEFKTKTGKIIPVSFSAVALIEANRLTSIVGLANDVSAEREFEEMKTGFVIMAAHELRTPLTSIIGYLSVLKDEQETFTAQQKSYLNKADVSTNHLSALVENLLSVLGIDRGGLRLNLEVVDWKAVLEETIKNFSQPAGEKNIKISIDCSDNLPKIKVDKFRISQMVSAILDNAIKNTDPKGKIAISSKIVEDKIQTSINDTGHGIPPSAIPNLFTKFFQVSPIMKTGGQGTGLSLFIAKAIVKMHHGKIWVESEVGVGSTFYFTLPITS